LEGERIRLLYIFRHFCAASLAATSKVFSVNWVEFVEGFNREITLGTLEPAKSLAKSCRF